jgi:hypothetical protein
LTPRLFRLDGQALDAVTVEALITGLRAASIAVVHVVEVEPVDGVSITHTPPIVSRSPDESQRVARSMRSAGFRAVVATYRRQ